MNKFNFFENWHLKLLSIVIAFLLWFYVASQKSINYTISAAFTYVNLPETLIITDRLPQTATMVLQGARDASPAVSVTKLEIPINLSDLKAGKNNVKINQNSINIPDGFKVVDITPGFIEMNVEKKKKKTIGIVGKLSGEPDNNLEIETITITPNTVEISGAESNVSLVSEIKTMAVSIDGITKSQKFETSLDTENIHFEIKPENLKINVEVKLKQKNNLQQ